jgi:antitoxin (DNA-binding transcriptional repressor) of toxin-antitoxin stability system
MEDGERCLGKAHSLDFILDAWHEIVDSEILRYAGMIEIDVVQVQADLPHYLEQVARGETIVVTRDNEPIAELRPIGHSVRKPRPVGLAKGTFEIPASFYEPLPQDVLDSFYGEGS